MQRDLVERAIAGDREAFSELARVSIGRLYVVARLILRDDAKAEDATQEALIAAWRNLSALRDPGRFDAWLRQTLVRCCYHEIRRDGQRVRLHGRIGAVDGVIGDPGDVLADRDQLERGFLRLPPDQRALIVLHYYVGLPLRETAETLGIPVGTVKSRLHRATRQMRAALEADLRLPTVEGRAL